MGGAGSADACRRVNEHFFVDRLPAACMDPDTQEFSKCPFGFVRRRFENNDDQLSSANIGGRPCVFARGVAANQLFYDVNRQADAVTTHAAPECVQALLGKGTPNRSMSLLSGEEFVARKKEVLRAFSEDALQMYWGEIVDVMTTYLDSWLQRGTVCMAKELEDMAFEISARCFIGAVDPAHVHKLRTIAGGASVLDVVGDPAVFANTRDALVEMVDEEMESEMKMEDGKHALDILLEGEMKMEDIKIEVCHFLLKGRDSLGRALKSFAVALTQHADARKGVEEEVVKVGSEIGYSAAGSMVFTGQVIKEVKRLNELGPLAWRIVTEDVKIGETALPAGTRIALSATQTHQDGAQYADPGKFDPARFGKERAEDKKNSGWCFSAHGTGVASKVHRCPAEKFTTQVLKIFALLVSTKCSWTASEGQDLTCDDQMTPKGGLEWKITAR